MDKQKIKHTAKVVANVNAHKRLLTRNEQKELKKINTEFNLVKDAFINFLFAYDWDEVTHLAFPDGSEVAIDELNMFQDFNNKWIAFCNRWKADRKHRTPINENAFHEFAINNTKTNENDKSFHTDNFKFPNVCRSFPSLAI